MSAGRESDVPARDRDAVLAGDGLHAGVERVDVRRRQRHRLAGSTSPMNTATGTAPMAARSDRLTAIALWPMSASKLVSCGGNARRRRAGPGSRRIGGSPARTAASSPMPRSPPRAGARRAGRDVRSGSSSDCTGRASSRRAGNRARANVAGRLRRYPGGVDSLRGLWNAVEAFADSLASVSFGALLVAILFHLANLVLRTRAWTTILHAAYPDEQIRWRDVFGAYCVGCRHQRGRPGARRRRAQALPRPFAHRGCDVSDDRGEPVAETVFDMAVGVAAADLGLADRHRRRPARRRPVRVLVGRRTTLRLVFTVLILLAGRSRLRS